MAVSKEFQPNTRRPPYTLASGLTTSDGTGPLRVTVGTQGTAVTARVPGTGIAFRQPITNTTVHRAGVFSANSVKPFPAAGDSE